MYIAITNRKLTSDILKQIERLENSYFDYIILREKDIPLKDYISLAEKAINISSKIILHSHIEACEALNYRKIHLPLDIFKKNYTFIKNYDLKGVSIHSQKDAKEAEKLGASYVTASPVFPTQCKKDAKPKGLDWLKEVCQSVNIPVYALGGIDSTNASICMEQGASGVCMMSGAMKY